MFKLNTPIKTTNNETVIPILVDGTTVYVIDKNKKQKILNISELRIVEKNKKEHVGDIKVIQPKKIENNSSLNKINVEGSYFGGVYEEGNKSNITGLPKNEDLSSINIEKGFEPLRVEVNSNKNSFNLNNIFYYSNLNIGKIIFFGNYLYNLNFAYNVNKKTISLFGTSKVECVLFVDINSGFVLHGSSFYTLDVLQEDKKTFYVTTNNNKVKLNGLIMANEIVEIKKIEYVPNIEKKISILGNATINYSKKYKYVIQNIDKIKLYGTFIATFEENISKNIADSFYGDL